MRELCRTMECNKKAMEALGSPYYKGTIKDEWHGFASYEEAQAKLSSITFEKLIEKAGIVGTTYFLSEDCKSVKYHSIASNLAGIFHSIFCQMNVSDFIEANILAVVEKQLGYNRAETIKITLKEDSKEPTVLCYLEAKTELCEVPKKQANSTGVGLRIVSLTTSKPNVSLAELFEETGIKNAVISNWIRKTIFGEISECMRVIDCLSETTVEQAGEVCISIKEAADKLSEIAGRYANEAKIICEKEKANEN